MLFVYIFICAMLIPSPAYAWGPATHVDLALALIGSASLLAPGVGNLISKFKNAFIYGMASPDIILGKKYLDYIYNCHNWSTGWKVLHRAKTDRQKSAAYGYLAHLAADTVAHNYYIPFKIIKSYKQKLPAHTYWEMVFDIGASETAWKHLHYLKGDPEIDTFLERHLRRLLFSYRINKSIFSTIVSIQRGIGLRKSVEFHASARKLHLDSEIRQHYWDMAFESALDILKNLDQSYVITSDPTGLGRIKEAKRLRNELRKRDKKGMLPEDEAKQFLDIIRGLLAMSIHRPGLRLPHFS